MSAHKYSLTSLLEVFHQFADDSGMTSLSRSKAAAVISNLFSVKTDVENWTKSDLETILNQISISEKPKQLISSFFDRIPTLLTKLQLSEFVLALKDSECSASTIKNYRSDINQFLDFIQESNIADLLTKPKIASFVRYQREKGLKDSSITRKLKSIAQFGLWAKEAGVANIQQDWLHNISIEDVLASATKTSQEKPAYIPQASKEEVTPKKNNSSKIHSNIKETVNTTVASSIAEWSDKIKQQIAWRTRNQILPYLNLALIILFFLGVTIFGYQQLKSETTPTLAFPSDVVRPTRVLSFQGRLTDTAQNPITTSTNMRFYLYNADTGGTQLWDSGTCSITPDQDGIFSTGLGDDCGSEISADVFSENDSIWLEVEVASETLTPRQPIRTVPYALNSETVQGFPINASESATANTILVMNEFGEVVLGENSPTLTSVSGTFTLEGEQIFIQTVPGSNGDITLSPDGTGGVNITSNTTIEGNATIQGYLAAPGATLSATYAGGTALIVQGGPGGTANIQEWQQSDGTVLSVVDENGYFGIGDTDPDALVNIQGTTEQLRLDYDDSNYASFTVANDGALTIAGTGTDADIIINPGGSFILSDLNCTGNTNGGVLTVDANGVVSCDDDDAGTAGTSYWRLTNGAFSPVNDTSDLLIGGESTASAAFAFINVNSGTPTASISGSTAGNALYITGDGAINTTLNRSLTLNENGGNVGIGDSSPASLFTVGNGDLFQVDSTGSIASIDGVSHTISDVGGDLVLNSNGGQINFADGDVFNIGGVTDQVYNAISDSGTATYANSDNDLYVEDILEVDGTLYVNGVIVDSSALWQNTSNVYHAANEYADIADLVIGGNSTASASIHLNATNGYISANRFQDLANSSYYLDPAATGYSLLTAGSIGIGDTTPDAFLNIQGTTEQLRLDYDDSNYLSFTVASDGTATLAGTGSDADIVLNPGGTGQLIFADLNCTANANGGALTVDGSGVVSCSDDDSSAGGSTSYWRLTNGAFSPVNDTADLLIGGESTASANFAFINNNGGTPTASFSGNLAIATPTGADPSINLDALNGGSFNFRTSVGGDAGSTTRVIIDNDGNLIPGADNTYNLGSDAARWANLYLGSGVASFGTSGDEGTIGYNTTTDAFSFSFGGAELTIDDVTNRPTFSSSTATAIDFLENLRLSADNLGVQIGAGQDLQLTHDGTDSFVRSFTNDLFIGADDDSTSSQIQFGLEDGTTVLGYFVTGVTNRGDFSVDSNTFYVDASSDSVGIGDSTPASLFTVGNGDLFQIDNTGSIINIDGVAHSIADVGGDLTLDSNGGQINFADGDVFNIGGITNQAYNSLSDAGTATYASSDNDLYIEDILEVDGTLYVGGNAIDPSALWQNTLNVYHAANEYADVADLVIGGTSTASASIHLNATNGYISANRFQDSANSSYYLDPAATGYSLLTAGSVGIGDTTPDAFLNIQGTTEQLRLDYDDSNYLSFTVASDGGVTLAGTGTDADITLDPGGDLIFADLDCSANANGGSLTVDSNGVVSCSDDDSAGGTNYWRLTDGALSPINDTYDLLIGGETTQSAVFAFMNVNSGTPTASISGNLALAAPTGSNPATSLDILNGGSFNLRTSVGGNAGLTSRLFIDNDGNVGIGTESPAAKLDIAGSSSTISNSSGDITLDAASDQINFSGDSLANLLNVDASGQIKPGGYGANPTAIGNGAIIYRSDQTQLYYYDGTTWQSIAKDESILFTNTANVIHPKNELAEIADFVIGGTSTSSANIHLNATNGYVSGQRFQDRANSAYYLDPAATDTSLTLVGKSGLGVSNPDFQLEVEGAIAGKALVGFNELGNQSIFVASSSGTNVFNLKNDGSITIGNPTVDDVSVELHGDLFQPDETKLETAFSDIRQTFLYDTTQDRDGGAWRKSIISKSLSWYTESKDDGFIAGCNLSTADRCGTSQFPAKVNLILTNNALYIMDVTTNKLWMKFDQGSSNALGSTTNNEPQTVYAKNGRLFVGTAGSSSETGLYEINFRTDEILYYDTTGRTTSDENIAGRNNGSHAFSGTEDAYKLSNDNINDIHGGYADGKQYLFLATDSGVNMIDLDYKLQYTYKEIASNANGHTITDDGDNGNDAVNAFDADPQTYVRSDAADSTLVVTYQFDEAKTIRRYGLVNEDIGTFNEFPSTWTFQGSNNGSTWTTLETKVDYIFDDVGTESNTQYFPLNNDNAYIYYRINVTDVQNAAADNVTIGELYLQERHQREAVRLFSDNVINNYTPAADATNDATTYSHRRVSDWRRINVNGEFVSESGVINPNLTLTLREPAIFAKYSVTPSNNTNQEPTDWDLKASNDGINWTTLSSESSVVFDTYILQTFDIPAYGTPYKHYRLSITGAVNTTTTTEVGDFMLGTPTITASSSFNDTTFDEKNLILQDGRATSYGWAASAGTTGEWIRYDYGAAGAFAATSYALRGYQAAQPTRFFTAWRFQGSHDGSSWTTLDTQTSQTFANDWDLKTYAFSNTTPYRYYRVIVDGVNGGVLSTLQGFYVFGSEERLFASSEENNAADNSSRLADYGDFGGWSSLANDQTGWIEKHFANGQEATVSGIVLTDTDLQTESVRDFTFQGSHDRNTWVDLGSVDRSYTSGTAHTRSYMFPNDTAYQYYRLNIEGNRSNGTVTSIDELSLLGSKYNNVRFTGNGFVATNVTTGQVDAFNNIFDNDHLGNNDEVDENLHKVLQWGGAGNLGTERDVALTTNTINSGIDNPRRTLPALGGGVENEKRAFEVDGNEIFYGHANGLDQIRLNTNIKLEGQDLANDDDHENRAQIQARYSTARTIANKYRFDHYWPMEENEDQTRIYDFGSGNAQSNVFGTADYDAIPTSSASGKIGRAFDFDDSSNENQAISFSDESMTVWDNQSSDEFSVGFWINPDGARTDTNYGAILGDYYAPGNIFGFMILLDGASQTLYYGGGAGGAGATINTLIPGAVAENDEWTHFVVNRVNGGEGNLLKTYKNGELVDVRTGVALSDGLDFYIGAGGSSYTALTFDGRIDEVFVKYDSLTEDEIRTIYNEGRTYDVNNTTSMEGANAITIDNASVTSSTTIGDSQLQMGVNEYAGRVVEITGGTGAGQSRLIVKNTATTVTVSPVWTSTPDSTSDFAITPYALPGSVDEVKAVRADQKDIFLGLNDGADGGGVVRVDRKGYDVIDYYHSGAAKTDDASTSWDTTSGYDDIIDIETTQDNLLIASRTSYWREKVGDSLTEAIDKLQQAFSAGLVDTHTVDHDGSSYRNYTRQVIRKGWSFIDADDTYREIHYGISYDEVPLVFATPVGEVAANTNGYPSSLEQCQAVGSGNQNVTVGNIERHKFGVAELTSNSACFTWLSIGNYSDSMPDGSFAGGADLAEWYGTDDTTLQAGEIVAIDKSGDIKVVRSGVPQDSSAIGIIATQPSITLGPESGLTPGYTNISNASAAAKTAVEVALAGRVPVRVSLENGPIEPGDYLTTGSVPGVAVKAISAGPTIGKAMERFDGTSTIIAIGDNASPVDTIGLENQVKNSVASDSAKINGSVQILDQDQQDLANGYGYVMAFVNTSYFDPNYANASGVDGESGDGSFAINSTGKLVGLGSYSFDLVDNSKYLNDALAEAEAALSASGSASTSANLSRENIMSAALARLKTLGSLSLKELNTAQLRVMDTIFSRKSQSDVAETDLLKPFVGNDLNFQIGDASQSGTLNIKNGNNEIVAQIDDRGNTTLLGQLLVNNDASVAGTLTANQLNGKSARLEELEARLAQLENIKAQTAEIVNATISGTLFANNIDGFQDKVAAALEEPSLLGKLLGEKKQATSSATTNNVTTIVSNAGYETPSIASDSASLVASSFNRELSDLTLDSNSISLAADAVFVNDYFKTNGNGFIAGSLGINQNLFVESTVKIGRDTFLSDGSISFNAATKNDTFSLQPSGRGTLSLMAGLLTLDESGQAVINGDLTVAGNLKVEDTLLTDLIRPTDFANPLQVQLATRSGEVAGATDEVQESRFEIVNELGTPVATISAQGRASFESGLGLGSENLTNTSTATDSATISTTKTAGTATVKAGTNQLVIESAQVSEDTLIYITPLGPTGNQVMYVKDKTTDNPDTDENEASFTVGFENTVVNDINFNWWIVN